MVLNFNQSEARKQFFLASYRDPEDTALYFPSICIETLTNDIPDRERLREYEEEMKKREEMEAEVKELEKYDKYARSCHYMMSTQVVCV